MARFGVCSAWIFACMTAASLGLAVSAPPPSQPPRAACARALRTARKQRRRNLRVCRGRGHKRGGWVGGWGSSRYHRVDHSSRGYVTPTWQHGSVPPRHHLPPLATVAAWLTRGRFGVRRHCTGHGRRGHGRGPCVQPSFQRRLHGQCGTGRSSNPLAERANTRDCFSFALPCLPRASHGVCARQHVQRSNRHRHGVHSSHIQLTAVDGRVAGSVRRVRGRGPAHPHDRTAAPRVRLQPPHAHRSRLCPSTCVSDPPTRVARGCAPARASPTPPRASLAVVPYLASSPGTWADGQRETEWQTT